MTSPGTGDVTHGGSVSGDHPEATSGVGGSRPVTPVVVGGPAGSRRATLDDVRGVVVAWDPSPAAATATAWGVAEAKRRGRPLWLVHADEWGVAHLGWRLGHAARRRMSAAAHEALRRAVAATAAEHPDVPVRGCLLAALAPQLLLAVSDRADVVVVGSEGLGGVTRMLLGSTSRAVAAGGGCPTVVVRHPGSAGAPRGGDAPVVVGIAGDAAGEAALDAAADWAAGTRRPLVVVRAWSVPPAPDLDDVPDVLAGLGESMAEDARTAVDAALARVAARHPEVTASGRTVEAPAAAALADVAANAWLAVVGRKAPPTHPRLGSTAQGLLHHAECPVAVVPTG